MPFIPQIVIESSPCCQGCAWHVCSCEPGRHRLSPKRAFRLLHLPACSGLLCVELGASGRLVLSRQTPSAPAGHLEPRLERQPAPILMFRVTECRSSGPGYPPSLPLHIIGGKIKAKKEVTEQMGLGNAPSMQLL